MQAFMTVMWIVLELMFLLMFYQLPSAVENEEEEVNNHTSKCPSSTSETRTGGLRTQQGPDDVEEGRNSNRNSVTHPQPSCQVHIAGEENERTPLFPRNTSLSVNQDVGSASEVERAPERMSERSPIHSRLSKAQQYVILVASEIVKEEIVVLLAVLFITVFSQTAIEVG